MTYTYRYKLNRADQRAKIVRDIRDDAARDHTVNKEVKVARILKTVAAGNLTLLKQLAVLNYTMINGHEPQGDTLNFWCAIPRERGDLKEYAEIAWIDSGQSEHDFLQTLVYDLHMNPSKAKHYLSRIETGSFSKMNEGSGAISRWCSSRGLDDQTIR